MANARAPSGASSTAAMPATMRTVLTNARFSSCAPVNTSNVGESAVRRLAPHAPTSPTRSGGRDPTGRRARWRPATPAPRPGRLRGRPPTPGPTGRRRWSPRRRSGRAAHPQKSATRATAASASRRPACSGVNGTGGTTSSGLSGEGASARSGTRSAGRRRGGAPGAPRARSGCAGTRSRTAPMSRSRSRGGPASRPVKRRRSTPPRRNAGVGHPGDRTGEHVH